SIIRRGVTTKTTRQPRRASTNARCADIGDLNGRHEVSFWPISDSISAKNAVISVISELAALARPRGWQISHAFPQSAAERLAGGRLRFAGSRPPCKFAGGFIGGGGRVPLRGGARGVTDGWGTRRRGQRRPRGHGDASGVVAHHSEPIPRRHLPWLRMPLPHRDRSHERRSRPDGRDHG